MCKEAHVWLRFHRLTNHHPQLLHHLFLSLQIPLFHKRPIPIHHINDIAHLHLTKELGGGRAVLCYHLLKKEIILLLAEIREHNHIHRWNTSPRLRRA